jgi:hypothetical protein
MGKRKKRKNPWKRANVEGLSVINQATHAVALEFIYIQDFVLK